MRRFLLKLRRRRRLEADLEIELAFHHDMARAQQNPVGLGNLALLHEQARDLWRFPLIEDFARDLGYAARWLRRTPAFTLTALLSLALGIGVNTAIFSLVDTVLLRSLPVERPGELEQAVVSDGAAERAQFSYPVYRDLRAHNTVFSSLFARSVAPASLFVGSQADRGVIEIASGNYFQALGVRPILGRLFEDADDRSPMAHPVAVLGFRYWKERLAADRAIAGKTIRIDNYPFTVIGVAPPGFFGVEVGTLPDAWVPLSMQPAVLGSGRRSFDEPAWNYLSLFGRRRPPVSSAQAQAELATLFRRVSQSLPPLNARRGALRLKPAAAGLSRLRETFEDPLYILMAIVGLLLLVACANLAGLLLARSAARHREIAVRLALGAGRGRLVRQLLAESLLLGLLGGALGLAFSGEGVRALLAFLPGGRLPLAIDASLDGRVLAFGFALSMVTGVLFGLVPAFHSTRLDLAPALKQRGPSAALGKIDLRFGFVALQLALSTTLVSGCLLFIQTLRNAASIPIGLDTANVVTASVNPALSGYSQPQVAGFYRRLESRLRATTAIRAVGLAEAPLLSGGGDQLQVTVPGPTRGSVQVMQNRIGGDFFEAAGISILYGRRFQPADTPDSPPVAIVNQTAAAELFGSSAALGQKLILANGSVFQIVGVARDSRYRAVREETPPVLYLSFGQERDPSRERTVYVKISGDPARSTAVVREVVRALDAHLPVYNLKTLAEQKAESLARERLTAGLSGLFAALALLLTTIGLYGVMAQTVARRSREIGIRMSLGAGRGAVTGMILCDALIMAGIGISGGLLLDSMLASAVGSQLYGVAPNDPATLAIGCAIQIAAAAAASLIPVWRAGSIDPAFTLRTE